MSLKQDISNLKIDMPNQMNSLTINPQHISKSTVGKESKESNPNSVYQKNEEEELKELERKE